MEYVETYKENEKRIDLDDALMHHFWKSTIVVQDRTGNEKGEDLCSVVVAVFDSEHEGGSTDATNFCKKENLHPGFFSITTMSQEVERSHRIKKPMETLESVQQFLAS